MPCPYRTNWASTSHWELPNGRATDPPQQILRSQGAGRPRPKPPSNPALPSASQNLSSALWRLGRYAASIDVLTQAVAASPDDGPLKTRLAWQLATGPDPRLRDGPRALALADSVRGSQRTLETIDATAAAYAEMGRFKEAVSTLRAGLALPQARTRTGQASAMRGRLSLYEEKRAFHQPPMVSPSS